LLSLLIVMAGHSRSKNGVASLACDPAIQLFRRRWITGSSSVMTLWCDG
jgi:hypothetical protein